MIQSRDADRWHEELRMVGKLVGFDRKRLRLATTILSEWSLSMWRVAPPHGFRQLYGHLPEGLGA